MIFKKESHSEGASKRVRILAWLSVLGWCCLIAALIVFHYGRPEQAYGILRYFDVPIRTTWKTELRFWYELLLYACALISVISLFINRNRVQKHHRICYNVVLLLLTSTAMLIILFMTD